MAIVMILCCPIRAFYSNFGFTLSLQSFSVFLFHDRLHLTLLPLVVSCLCAFCRARLVSWPFVLCLMNIDAAWSVYRIVLVSADSLICHTVCHPLGHVVALLAALAQI